MQVRLDGEQVRLDGEQVRLDGEQVRSLREERGMNKGDLARAAGVSKDAARRAERGELVLPATGRKVAKALGVDPPQRLGRAVRRG